MSAWNLAIQKMLGASTARAQVDTTGLAEVLRTLRHWSGQLARGAPVPPELSEVLIWCAQEVEQVLIDIHSPTETELVEQIQGLIEPIKKKSDIAY